MILQRRQVWIGIGIVVLIPILVPLITLHGARARILRALNADLGRGIQADAVHLRLFPLPGVELDGVRVAEDPAFGLEDMVVADDATAAVRLSSLLTGRLVFARIHLDRPSINLVRNRAGQWNITALLDRAGRLGAGNGRGGGVRPSLERFPYMEWSDARVNFKLEQTKQRFYLDQVQGSLARDNAGWRLQARFQPQRTDLNLSDTGDVTVDGRWPAGGAVGSVGFHQRPFDLVLRVQNSYLAGSSALVAGHDAGVHGILAAQIHVQGTGQQFQISGALQAQALRRWDLLPPPATVSCAFTGVYYPGQDRFALEGAGDPGFRHLRLQGDVSNIFTHPSADLSLSLHQFAAANLLPLVMAVKAHLPAHLQAEGVADGQAQLRWTNTLQGSARFSLAHFRLFTDQEQLELPTASIVWDGHRLRLPPTAATVGPTSSPPPTALRLSAAVDRQGFQFQLDSVAFTGSAAHSLARLFGLRSPWPPALAGTAQLDLSLASAWSGFRQTGWKGEATLKRARFQTDGADFGLTNVAVQFDDPRPLRVSFTTTLADAKNPPAPIAGAVRWSAAAASPVQFDLRALHLRDAAVWRFLHPPPSDLVQRVFGDVTPDWVGRLRASGAIAVDDLDWHGIHAGVKMRLDAAPGHWEMSSLVLALAQGVFAGSGRLEGGNYRIAGGVSRNHALRLAALLETTPYRGLLSGLLSGSLELTRPASGVGMEQLDAAGDFDLRRGSLATSEGEMPFNRFAATYRLHQGAADLAQVRWEAAGERWEGQGTAVFDSSGLADFDLRLRDRGRQLRLTAPRRPRP